MIQDRARAFELAFPKWPASWPRVGREQGRDVLYATWLIGNDYRNASKFYGAYPPGYLKRIGALFPEVPGFLRLHVFSGSLPAGEVTRLDSDPANKPDVVGSVYDVDKLFARQGRFQLILADPPYSATDAAKYGTPMINRGRALAALATVAAPGGHLVWLDTVWPMHRKTEWRTVGRITVVRSTNHRVRLVSIFERTR